MSRNCTARWALAAYFFTAIGAIQAVDLTDAKAVNASIARLKDEIEAEKAAAEADRLAWAAELTEARKQRAELADKLLTAQLETTKLTSQKQSLELESRSLLAEAQAIVGARNGAINAAATAAEQLSIHLSEVPGQEAALAQLKPIMSELRQPADAAATTQKLAELWNSAIAEAMSIGVRPATIWRAGGTRAEVKLLMMGHAGCAWESAEGAAALALHSATDASGHRWAEQLPKPLQAAIRAGIAQVQSGGAMAMIPIDISGRLQVESAQADQDLIATIKSGGPVMLPLGLVAAVSLLLLVERSFVLFVLNRFRTGAVRGVIQAVKGKDYNAAEKLAQSGGGATMRVLAACLKRREAGQHAMEDSIQEQLLHETPRLQRFIGGMSVIAAASPLLGLLGTVTGIIQTFNAIYSMGTANPSAMAGGISEALVATAAGLIVAIPTLLSQAFLRGRVERVICETEKQAAALLNVLAHDK